MGGRLIDADAIITFVSAGHLRNPMEKTWSDNDVVDMIESRPTVDAVPVVRCGECKHRFVDGENVRYNVCELTHNKVQSDDWFCADGERKDGADDGRTD